MKEKTEARDEREGLLEMKEKMSPSDDAASCNKYESLLFAYFWVFWVFLLCYSFSYGHRYPSTDLRSVHLQNGSQSSSVSHVLTTCLLKNLKMIDYVLFSVLDLLFFSFCLKVEN